jgi:hypothetical protein
LRCEKLRPELFRLTERLDYEAPTATAVVRHGFETPGCACSGGQG